MKPSQTLELQINNLLILQAFHKRKCDTINSDIEYLMKKQKQFKELEKDQ